MTVRDYKGYRGTYIGMRNTECGIKTPNSLPSEAEPLRRTGELPACQKTCSAGRRTPNSKGFTLIETIIVIVIIAILMAVVIPRVGFDASPRASVDGAAHMIASDIRYAQEFAMATRTSKTITFGGNSYTFSPSHSLDPSGRLPSGVTTTALTLTFNSLGEPTTGGGGSITVSGSGTSKTITVTQYTGKVNVN